MCIGTPNNADHLKKICILQLKWVNQGILENKLTQKLWYLRNFTIDMRMHIAYVHTYCCLEILYLFYGHTCMFTERRRGNHTAYQRLKIFESSDLGWY